MTTRTYQIKTDYAMGLLQYLEKLQAIVAVPASKLQQPQNHLSDLLVGSIPNKKAKNFHKQLQQLRNEWERNI